MKRRAATLLMVVSLFGLTLTTNAGARFLLALMRDESHRLEREIAVTTQAIVTLSGHPLRVAETARLHRATGLPILLAGKGAGDGRHEAESETMAWSLRTEHGIEPRWVEMRSVNTYENAVESWCLLHPLGVQRIVLVTGAQHMRRASYEFNSVGFAVTHHPVSETPSPTPFVLEDFIPSPEGWRSVQDALREYGELSFSFLQNIASPPFSCGTGATSG